jgi:hypothetical protein
MQQRKLIVSAEYPAEGANMPDHSGSLEQKKT